ncbi:MAG: SDR family NAD(P)-dependent oxidoreductase [bacterium]
MAESLTGKTALVTGAAKRVGRAIALALAGEGVNVVVHYHDSRAEAEELCQEIAQCDVRTWAIAADLSVAEEYGSLITRAHELAGTLDILVNNASIFPAETLGTVTRESMIANLEVNAWAPFVLGRDFAQQFGRGKIINMLDSRLRGYDWTHVGYIISKHAFEQLTRMCALQYAPYITVNGVGPGLILPPPGEDISYIERLQHTVPLKRCSIPKI